MWEYNITQSGCWLQLVGGCFHTTKREKPAPSSFSTSNSYNILEQEMPQFSRRGVQLAYIPESVRLGVLGSAVSTIQKEKKTQECGIRIEIHTYRICFFKANADTLPVTRYWRCIVGRSLIISLPLFHFSDSLMSTPVICGEPNN